MAYIKKTQVIADSGRHVENEKFSSIAAGIGSRNNYSGNQSGDSSENWT